MTGEFLVAFMVIIFLAGIGFIAKDIINHDKKERLTKHSSK